MDNNTLRDNFTGQLTNVHALTVLTVSVIEIIGYIVLIQNGVEQFSIDNRYLWYGGEEFAIIFPPRKQPERFAM